MPPARQDIETRLQGLLADHLDSVAEQNPDGFDIGVVAIVTEVRYPASPEYIELVLESRRRPEAGYTPEAESPAYVAFTCSDSRNWIAAGLLRAASGSLDLDYLEREEEEEEGSESP